MVTVVSEIHVPCARRTFWSSTFSTCRLVWTLQITEALETILQLMEGKSHQASLVFTAASYTKGPRKWKGEQALERQGLGGMPYDSGVCGRRLSVVGIG